MANGTTNGRAHVIEISNRASLNGSDADSINGRIDNHVSSANSNAHSIGNINGLTAALSGKSDNGHTHTIANVSGLQGTLDGKSSTGHGHSIADVANLQSTLDGKESTFSKNTAFNKNFGTSAGSVCQGNDSRLSDSRNPTAHMHTLSDLNLAECYTGNIVVVGSIDFDTQSVQYKTLVVVDGLIRAVTA